MHSIRHGLKTCEKTLNAKKFTIKVNMDCYHLPLSIMNGYFKQVTIPKAISDSENGEYLLNKLTKFKKNSCKIVVIEYNPLEKRCMAPVWDMFIEFRRNGSNSWSQGQSTSYSAFCLQGNMTPTRSQSNTGIASITSTIVQRFVTASTRQLSTLTIPSHLQ
jgi:hypothetical protein